MVAEQGVNRPRRRIQQKAEGSAPFAPRLVEKNLSAEKRKAPGMFHSSHAPLVFKTRRAISW